MTYVETFLKAAGLVLAALLAVWAATALGGFEPPLAADHDCAAAQMRPCFFTII